MECVGYDHAFVKDMQEKLPHWKPKSEATGQKASGRVLESETEDGSGPNTPLRRTLRQRKCSSRLRELMNEEEEEEEEGDEGEMSDGDSDYEY